MKLLAETPVTASLKAAVKLIGPLVTGAAMLSVTAVTVGARVSIWRVPVGLTLSAPVRTAALPAASVIAPPFSVSALIVAVVRSAASWPLPVAPTV